MGGEGRRGTARGRMAAWLPRLLLIVHAVQGSAAVG